MPVKKSDLKVDRKQSWIFLRRLLYRLRSMSVCIPARGFSGNDTQGMLACSDEPK